MMFVIFPVSPWWIHQKTKALTLVMEGFEFTREAKWNEQIVRLEKTSKHKKFGP